MKTLLILSALCLAAPSGRGDAGPGQDTADAQRYCVVFLRPHTARKPITQPDRDRIMAAHMANIHRMADEGVLAAAGPMDVHPWLGPRGVGDAYFKRAREHPEAKDTMASHLFCVLKRGPGAPEPGGDHARFIDGLRRAGALAAAGRVESDPALAWIVIFKAATPGEAAGVLQGDPAVASGSLIPEFHAWWTADLVLPL